MNRNLIIPVTLTMLFPAMQAVAGTSGAIFTTIVDGTIVNANVQYTSKCDVYLDGGPGPNAPAKAAGLPAGEYYFQVTDPNGSVLLSTDPVSNRKFMVSPAGVIVAYTGSGGPPHPTGIDHDHPELGAITIRLANIACPNDFLSSPINGGIYKVWATRTTDFLGDPTKVDNPCGSGCFHGFLPARTKTDNFKVRSSATTFCLTVAKQLVTFGGVTPVANWEIHVADTLGVSNTFFTDAVNGQTTVCDLQPGTYSVSEVLRDGWEVVGLVVNGIGLPPQTVYSFTWVEGNIAPMIVFQNAGPTPQ